MKILLKIITIILFALIGYFAYVLKSKVILTAACMGFAAGVLYMQSFILILKDKLKNYKRQIEKVDISKTENSSKVEVLEQKIEVLEKALKSALEDKNN